MIKFWSNPENECFKKDYQLTTEKDNFILAKTDWIDGHFLNVLLKFVQ